MAKMTTETLEEQIKRRADNRAQQKISRFKQDILNACQRLTEDRGSYTVNTYTRCMPERFRELLAVVASGNAQQGWPAWLWEEERHRVTAEVMATMNELQKVLLAPDEPGENRPAPGPEEEL